MILITKSSVRNCEILLTLRRLDLGEVLLGNEILGRLEGALELGEQTGYREALDLLLENVHLIEEEDEVGRSKEGVVNDALEQFEALLHPVGDTILKEDLGKHEN